MYTLVTGGAGFIGSHLSESLLERGARVVALDNMSSASERNLERLRSMSGFRLVHGTVNDRPLMERLIDGADTIYHLASTVGVQLVTADPTAVIDTIVNGTEVVLQTAARGRKRVLLTSTSEVYGRRDRIPFREDEDLLIGPPDNGRWSYACSKLLDEFLALAYCRKMQLPIVVTRLFNVVGPRQTGRYGMVVPTLVDQALSGEPMTVFGDGSQRRCFTHVKDAVRGLMALAEHPDAVGHVYNVGSTNEITILDLARRVQALADSSSEIRIVPIDQITTRGGEDMQRRVPDLTRIHALTGYRAVHGIDTILGDTIAHHRAQRAKDASQTDRESAAAVARPVAQSPASDLQY